LFFVDILPSSTLHEHRCHVTNQSRPDDTAGHTGSFGPKEDNHYHRDDGEEKRGQSEVRGENQPNPELVRENENSFHQVSDRCGGPVFSFSPKPGDSGGDYLDFIAQATGSNRIDHGFSDSIAGKGTPICEAGRPNDFKVELKVKVL
jgi:hypothetical protein